MNLTDKKVLITGGSSGIGRAIVEALYQSGTRNFAVAGRDESKLKQLGKDFPDAAFLYLHGNVGNPTDVKAFMAKVDQEWAGLDILINNAGVVSAGALEDISDEDIISQIDINVTGLILLTKHALVLLKKSPEAAIINVSSGLGIIGLPFYATYAAAKAGTVNFSEALRRELQDFPIQVMTVYPTATDTPMMKTANTSNMDTPEAVAESTIKGLLAGEIDVFRGGTQMLENRKLNFEHPLEYDEKVKGMYDSMKERASKHRAM